MAQLPDTLQRMRAGVSLPNPAARIYPVSAAGLKIWRIGSAVMWAGLAIWLFTSRDQEGRLNEWWWLVIILAWCLWYLFGRAVAAFDQLRRAQRGDGPS
jgi:hypothetical protein